MLAQYSMKTKS